MAMMRKRKPTTCIRCGNETYQKDSICILCRTDITRIHEELVDLLATDNKKKSKKKKGVVVGGK